MGTRSRLIRSTRLVALTLVLLALCGAGLRDTVAQTEQEQEDGLVGERRYESPQYDYAVEWQEPWDVFSVISVPDGKFDTLALSDGASVVSFLGSGDRESPAAQIELTVDNLQQSEPDLVIVAQNVAGDVASATFEFTAPAPADGVETLVRLYVEATALPFPQSVLTVMLRAAVEDFDSEMAAAQAGITLDGAPPFSGQAAPEDDADPTPEAEPDEPAAEGGALDLAAMTLRPADLDGDYGLAGSYTMTLDEQVETIIEQRGGGDNEIAALRQVLTDAGWQRNYVNVLAEPSAEDPGLFGIAIASYVTEYTDADGAAAGFAELENEEEIADSEDVPGSGTIGDQSEITLTTGTTTDTGTPYHSLDLTFQTGNLVGGVSLTDYTGTEPDVDAAEALAETLLARMTEVTDDGTGDGLSTQVARLAGTSVDTFYDHYERLADETFPYFGDADADHDARGQSHADSGFTDVYYLAQAIGWDGGASSDYVYYLVILDRFASEEDAAAWIADAPAAFAANPGAYEDVTVLSEISPLGDESAGVSYRYPRVADVTVTGYALYIRVGSVVVTVQVDAPSDIALSSVEALAEAQVDCLTAGNCVDPLPVPDDLLSVAPAPDEPVEPEEREPMNQADKLRDLFDDLD